MVNERIVIIASIRKSKDIDWLQNILRDYNEFWVVVDNKSAQILARNNLLNMISSSRLMVYSGKNPEEFALKVYKVAVPDVVCVCDEHGVLRAIVDFIKFTPVKIISC
ncbi:MAG: hypothetical protein QXE10_05725 [Desulfurococcaceae archaeon]|jgi:folylpolyglutamate synthase/dihydropteroate synthase